MCASFIAGAIFGATGKHVITHVQEQYKAYQLRQSALHDESWQRMCEELERDYKPTHEFFKPYKPRI
jgi:hypothetical protein